jgi:hypothetical protein
MKRKDKLSQGAPSLRDRLSSAFLEAFQQDFEANGVAAIEQLRLKSPEKYSEIAARLIAATEPAQDVSGFAGCNSMFDIGERLLQQVGVTNPSEEQVARAVAANDAFMSALEMIRDESLQ